MGRHKRKKIKQNGSVKEVGITRRSFLGKVFLAGAALAGLGGFGYLLSGRSHSGPSA